MSYSHYLNNPLEDLVGRTKVMKYRKLLNSCYDQVFNNGVNSSVNIQSLVKITNLRKVGNLGAFPRENLIVNQKLSLPCLIF